MSRDIKTPSGTRGENQETADCGGRVRESKHGIGTVFQIRSTFRTLQRWRDRARSLGLTLSATIVVAMECLEEHFEEIFDSILELQSNRLLADLVQRAEREGLDLANAEQISEWIAGICSEWGKCDPSILEVPINAQRLSQRWISGERNRQRAREVVPDFLDIRCLTDACRCLVVIQRTMIKLEEMKKLPSLRAQFLKMRPSSKEDIRRVGPDAERLQDLLGAMDENPLPIGSSSDPREPPQALETRSPAP